LHETNKFHNFFSIIFLNSIGGTQCLFNTLNYLKTNNVKDRVLAPWTMHIKSPSPIIARPTIANDLTVLAITPWTRIAQWATTWSLHGCCNNLSLYQNSVTAFGPRWPSRNKSRYTKKLWKSILGSYPGPSSRPLSLQMGFFTLTTICEFGLKVKRVSAAYKLLEEILILKFQ
jgi:hypothetical protein